jgi:hypothetical protein
LDVDDINNEVTNAKGGRKKPYKHYPIPKEWSQDVTVKMHHHRSETPD